MPRPRPPDQIHRLLDAATRVFARRGLRRSRMTDIAQEAGLAPGTLYHYFESKEAIFYYVLQRGTAGGETEIPEPLPVPDPGRERLNKFLESQAARARRLPALEHALDRELVGSARAELEEIVRQLYDRIARGRQAMTVIEASAVEQPELAAIWYLKMRRSLLERLAHYIERRSAAGALRVTEDATVAARFVLETCVFFARNRHGDPIPGDLPNSETVRSATVDLVVHALVADGPAGA